MFFFSNHLKLYNNIKNIIKERRNKRVYTFSGALKFTTGDILSIIFWVKNYIYSFEGLCICLRKKKLIKKDVSLILRNIILGVGMEFCISYYFNRIFFLNILDYKRKRLIYKRAKLYYIRLKANKESNIKSYL